MMRILAASLAAAVLLAASAAAQSTWTVDADGGGDFSSIEQACATAASGDTVVIRSGNYTFVGDDEIVIEGNRIGRNDVAGVAIEHGEDNRIVYNIFSGNREAIRLWWDDDEELLASAFARRRACDSRGYLVALNSFDGDGVAVRLDRTVDVRLLGNHFENVGAVLHATGSALVVRDDDAAPRIPGTKDETVFPGEQDAFLPAGHPRVVGRGEAGHDLDVEAQLFVVPVGVGRDDLDDRGRGGEFQFPGRAVRAGYRAGRRCAGGH